MNFTYLRFLISVAFAAIPASVVYTLLGYYFLPDISSKGNLSAFLFVLFFVLVLVGSLVVGSAQYFILLRKFATVKRFFSFPIGLAAVWIGGAVFVGRPVVTALPFSTCLVVLCITSYLTLLAITDQTNGKPAADADIER